MPAVDMCGEDFPVNITNFIDFDKVDFEMDCLEACLCEPGFIAKEGYIRLSTTLTDFFDIKSTFSM